MHHLVFGYCFGWLGCHPEFVRIALPAEQKKAAVLHIEQPLLL